MHASNSEYVRTTRAMHGASDQLEELPQTATTKGTQGYALCKCGNKVHSTNLAKHRCRYGTFVYDVSKFLL